MICKVGSHSKMNHLCLRRSPWWVWFWLEENFVSWSKAAWGGWGWGKGRVGCNLGGWQYSWLNTFVKNLPFRKDILTGISEVILVQNCVWFSGAALNDLYFSEIIFIKSSVNMLWMWWLTFHYFIIAMSKFLLLSIN